MKLTPQQLIDLPGAGMAEKQLRKDGRWELTAIEHLWKIPEDHCTNLANLRLEQAITMLEAKEAQCN